MTPLSQTPFIYLYDGSFYGLLTIIFNCYVEKHIPLGIQCTQNYCNNFLEKTKTIKTEEEKAQRIFNRHTKFNFI